MGMDLIGVGYTVDTPEEPSVVLAQLVVGLHRESIETAWEQIDEDGKWDEPGLVFDSVMAGTVWFGERNAMRMSVSYKVPGHDNRRFYFAGGGSWGDEPFEGFDHLCMFLNACAVIPKLGRSLGVLGCGIYVR